MYKSFSFLALSAAMASSFASGEAQAIDEKTPDILAAQLRDQGFECKKAQSAEREKKASAPNETVWVLTCENGVYRMTLVPDMAAKIEKIKN